LYHVYNFLNKKWYIDKLYNELIIQHVLSSGYQFSYKAIDRGFLEVFGPTGLSLALQQFTTRLDSFQTGLPYNYLRSIVFYGIYAGLMLLFVQWNIPLEIVFLFLIFEIYRN